MVVACLFFLVAKGVVKWVWRRQRRCWVSWIKQPKDWIFVNRSGVGTHKQRNGYYPIWPFQQPCNLYSLSKGEEGGADDCEGVRT